jgi:nicotinamide-nucleotide amidase
LREVGNPIAELLGDRIYSEKPNETLEQVIGCLLRKRLAKVAAAESCTGGLIASRLTENAGSSDFFVGAYVAYTNKQKEDVLGVPAKLIAKHTAVSEPVAAAMAEGARQRSGATYAISTTGYAGPSGGTEYDPVGTVYFGIAGPAPTRVVRVRYGLGRYRVRTLATQAALDLLRKTLLASPPV